jgi:HAE1 family hydrophobic/amphiphilic exporter-1
MWIADLCIRRPVLAIMMVGALMGLGFISMSRISIDLFPNVEVPIVTVETVLDGASPGTMEIEVTDKLEEEFISIAGVKSLRSVSADGFSQIIIEFEMEEDPNFKAQEVRDKVSQIMPELPDTVEQPVVTMLDSESEPIIAVIVSGSRPVGEITGLCQGCDQGAPSTSIWRRRRKAGRWSRARDTHLAESAPNERFRYHSA